MNREIEASDFHLQVVGLSPARDHAGVASLVALFSLIQDRSVLPGLVVLGDMTLQGQVRLLASVAELLQTAMDNGARKVLLPIENRRHMLDVPERVDGIYYPDPVTAARKALGLG